jgi:hypothetical protein
VHRPGMYVSQMRRRFVIAACDRADCPATYRRIIQDSSVGDFSFFNALAFLGRDLLSFFGADFFPTL